ncbi:hypothetical protein SDC9_04115 [bioreactor metagenome]|uniref:Uncharacterized protein n=1 Tax=bioreactor metagenome TaxID=1076179 RepID=A0A644SY64_9ZZZZ
MASVFAGIVASDVNVSVCIIGGNAKLGYCAG